MPIRSFIVDVLIIHTNKTKALVFKFDVINCNTEKFCINQSGVKSSRFYCKWHENRPPHVHRMFKTGSNSVYHSLIACLVSAACF